MRTATFLNLLVLFLLCSCSPAYIPNKVNVGLFTEPGEVHAEINTGVSGADVQVAVAAPKNIAFFANGSFKETSFERSLFLAGLEVSSIEGENKHRVFEVGSGYYSDIFGENLLFEFFGGYGRGNHSNLESDLTGLPPDTPRTSDNTVVSEASYDKFFIQPTFGISTKHFDMGTTVKLTNVRMNIDGRNLSDFYYEPALTMRGGFKHLKATSQIGFSLPFGEDERIQYNTEPFIFSVGLMLDLDIFNSVN